MSLLNDLKWRYATKKYDANKQVSEEQIGKIIEAARLAPSSYGLQPFKIISINNQQLKEKLVPIAWNQKVVAECSHVLVFAAWENYSPERIEEIFDHIANERGFEKGNAFGPRTSAIADLHISMTDEEAFRDTEKQTCIAFGFAIAQAAELRVDTTPIGGFDKKALDELLALDNKGLRSVYLLAVGHRNSEGDWSVKQKKVRTDKRDFLIEIN